MSECAGSCGIMSQKVVSKQPNVMDSVKENYDRHMAAKQEIRKGELNKKGEKGNLTTSEAMELAGYRIQDGLNFLAKLNCDSICYLA